MNRVYIVTRRDRDVISQLISIHGTLRSANKAAKAHCKEQVRDNGGNLENNPIETDYERDWDTDFFSASCEIWLEDRHGPSRDRCVVEVQEKDVILNGSDYDSSESEHDDDDDGDGGQESDSIHEAEEQPAEDSRLQRMQRPTNNQTILRTGPLTFPPLPASAAQSLNEQREKTIRRFREIEARNLAPQQQHAPKRPLKSSSSSTNIQKRTTSTEPPPKKKKKSKVIDLTNSISQPDSRLKSSN